MKTPTTLQTRAQEPPHCLANGCRAVGTGRCLAGGTGPAPSKSTCRPQLRPQPPFWRPGSLRPLTHAAAPTLQGWTRAAAVGSTCPSQRPVIQALCRGRSPAPGLRFCKGGRRSPGRPRGCPVPRARVEPQVLESKSPPLLHTHGSLRLLPTLPAGHTPGPAWIQGGWDARGGQPGVGEKRTPAELKRRLLWARWAGRPGVSTSRGENDHEDGGGSGGTISRGVPGTQHGWETPAEVPRVKPLQ